jgi:hypothetical protein
VFGLVAAVCVGVASRRLRGVGRQRRLMLLCQHAGLDFAPLDGFGDTLWLPFAMFGRERSGTENVVWERERGREIRAFDFWYRDPRDEGGFSPRRSLTCAVVPLGASAPSLRISPRDLADGVRAALGTPEVRLELEAFNRRFDVECEDPRFAVAFLEQRMMEALLALPDGVGVDVNEDVVLLSAPLMPAEEVLRLFEAAVAIHERIPRSLRSLFPPRPARGPHEQRWLQGHWSAEPTEA